MACCKGSLALGAWRPACPCPPGVKLLGMSSTCGPLGCMLQANTNAVVHVNKAMNHVEGGWPKEVDYTEAEQVIRYKKKVGSRWAWAGALLLHLATTSVAGWRAGCSDVSFCQVLGLVGSRCNMGAAD